MCVLRRANCKGSIRGEEAIETGVGCDSILRETQTIESEKEKRNFPVAGEKRSSSLNVHRRSCIIRTHIRAHARERIISLASHSTDV